jgi:hypothetical protein
MVWSGLEKGWDEARRPLAGSLLSDEARVATRAGWGLERRWDEARGPLAERVFME